jgi:hypothetical protein
MASKPARDQAEWQEGELVVLIAFLLSRGLSELTDSHTTCQQIAEALRRTPASVERQARNIMAIVAGKEAYNVGAPVYKVIHNYYGDHQKSYDRAQEVMDENEWDLPSLQ